MKLSKLIENLDTSEINADLELDITGLGCSSDTVRKGEIFIAVTGYKTDGHQFIGDAVSKGASCIVCQKKPDARVPYIIVRDTRVALAVLSAAWFRNPASKLKIIGVTGTNGKTSITYILRHIIESITKSKVGLIGTTGNYIGGRELKTALTTPDSYELHSLLDKMVFEGCKYAVMEVSSHALYLNRVYGINFEAGIYTNLTPDHLDFHESMDEYAEAKAILFENSKGSVLNIDDSYAAIMKERSAGDVMTYSLKDPKADILSTNVQLTPGSAQFDITYKGVTNYVRFTVPGMFSVYNATAAFGAGVLLGFESADMVKALETFEGVRGRAEVIDLGREYTVMIDYAHTPDALKNIILTARSITDGAVVTLFGCGGDRDREKRPLMGKIAQQLSDIVVVTSDNPRTENPRVIIDDILEGITEVADANPPGERSLIVIENRREAIYKALEILQARDVLIIAGKGHETYQILGTEKTHFDDREVVDDYFRKIRDRRKTLRATV